MSHDALSDFDLVLFGATGDLAMRKLLPCLYRAHAAGLLHPDGRIWGVSRSRFTTAEFLEKMERDARVHLRGGEGENDAQWVSFCRRISYLPLDIGQPEDFAALAEALRMRNSGNIVVYLSTAPKFFAPACDNLAAVGLNTPDVRIVLEKPLGTDLDSSQQINAEVGRFFKEDQVYRIDHYLGKESLQNLLPLRFANVFFEPVWNSGYVKSVQITIAETLGVEERGEFYDGTGALRDMVQNHLMQMLCFVAMERPKSLSADDVRDAKLHVLQSLVPFSPETVGHLAVRGQYAGGGGMKGYLQEHKVPAGSRTETYAAIQAAVDTPRWRGVPFYLRTGKRMAGKTAEIVLNFKRQPENAELFGGGANRIVITLQPDETVRLRLFVKRPGSGLAAAPAEMALDLAHAVPGRRAEAYELLLREVIGGRLALFNRRDELEAAWRWLMPVLEHWASSPVPPHAYPAGSWGPEAARALPAANGDAWLEEQDYSKPK